MFPNLQVPQSPSSSWHGRLDLTFDRQAEKTVLSYGRAEAPLKIQRPFYPEGDHRCHSVLLHTAGGMVGGDRLSLNLNLAPHAQALVTTAAAAKVYRSNGQEVQQTIQMTVASGACLEWLPQETILFDGSMYQQNLRVDLATDAVWLGWDVARLGRSARGETFSAGSWRSQIQVWQGDRLVWVDPQWVQGGHEMMASPHGLAGCPVIGSFALVGLSISEELVEQARELWQKSRAQEITTTSPHSSAVPHRSGCLSGAIADVGVTRLMSGLLCRYRGQSSAEARRWFIQVWHLLRRSCLHSSECIPRVWQL